MFTDLYRYRIAYAPNTLTLCKMPVKHIAWQSAYQDSAEGVWNKLIALQEQPQALTHQDFCALLDQVDTLRLSQLTISTDAATLEIRPYHCQHCTLTLFTGETLAFSTARPNVFSKVSDTVQVLDTALYLLPHTATKADAEKALLKTNVMGLTHSWQETV